MITFTDEQRDSLHFAIALYIFGEHGRARALFLEVLASIGVVAP